MGNVRQKRARFNCNMNAKKCIGGACILGTWHSMRSDKDGGAGLQSQMPQHPCRRKYTALIGREFKHARIGEYRRRRARGGRHFEREGKRRVFVIQQLEERAGQQQLVAGQIVARVNRQLQTQRLTERGARGGAREALHFDEGARKRFLESKKSDELR